MVHLLSPVGSWTLRRGGTACPWERTSTPPSIPWCSSKSKVPAGAINPHTQHSIHTLVGQPLNRSTPNYAARKHKCQLEKSIRTSDTHIHIFLGQAINRLINQPINQSTNQWINQWMSGSSKQTLTRRMLWGPQERNRCGALRRWQVSACPAATPPESPPQNRRLRHKHPIGIIKMESFTLPRIFCSKGGSRCKATHSPPLD